MNRLTLFSIFVIISMALALPATKNEGENVKNVDKEDAAPEFPIVVPRDPDCFNTMEINPVCGSNGITYMNSGEFHCHAMTPQGKAINMVIKHHGPC